jgi:transcriptional regulator with XRE-family HTH domain
MTVGALLEHARLQAGLTQAELAHRAGTSRPTLSAYENQRKAPTTDTASRILGAAGYEFAVVPSVTFTAVTLARGASAWVPDKLWRLPARDAVRDVLLPLHLDWSQPARLVSLRVRGQRALVYEVVLREGTQGDIRELVDGALLIDVWPDLVLPRSLRSAWEAALPEDFGVDPGE